MILGLGVDLVSIARMDAAWTRRGMRLAERILGGTEREDFARTSAAGAFLARRFAAKEAFAKALGCGIGAGLRLVDVQVAHAARGAPRLAVAGTAAALALRQGVRRMHLSLSDDGDYAVASVILEGTEHE